MLPDYSGSIDAKRENRLGGRKEDKHGNKRNLPLPDHSATQHIKQLGHPVSLCRSAGRRGQALLAQGYSICDRVCAGATVVVSGVWVLKMSAVTGRQPSSTQEIKSFKL